MINKDQPVILSVDDEPLHNIIVQSVLGKFGVSVIATTSPPEFWQEYKRGRPSLCFVDINIQTLGDGFEVIRSLRQEHKQSVPIIVISQKGDKEALAHAMELGATDFIVKPVDKELLVEKLRQYLVTDQLAILESSYIPVPQALGAAVVDLEATVQEVDELGIKLVSPHLPLKGTTLLLDGPLISEITGQEDSYMFTITSTWLYEDGVKYGLFAEFDTSNEFVMTNLRKWLIKNSVPVPKKPMKKGMSET
jgi:CheY-like chemotaxis protein